MRGYRDVCYPFSIPTRRGVGTIFDFLSCFYESFLHHVDSASEIVMAPCCYLPMSTHAIRNLFTVFRSSANEIIVDVFFQRSSCFLYQTDIVFDFMNALGEWTVYH